MSVYLPCRCGAPRSDLDLGSGRCAECRKRAGEISDPELRAALARCDRQSGGATPRVSWVTERDPSHLWGSAPPPKENPRRVLVVEVDA